MAARWRAEPWLPTSRRRLLVRAWALLCLLLAIRAFAYGMLEHQQARGLGAEPVRVDLNRAPLEELQALPGIGPERARRILLHRVRHGPLASVDALCEVDGIGVETVEALSPFAVVTLPPRGP